MTKPQDFTTCLSCGYRVGQLENLQRKLAEARADNELLKVQFSEERAAFYAAEVAEQDARRELDAQARELEAARAVVKAARKVDSTYSPVHLSGVGCRSDLRNALATLDALAQGEP